MFFIIPIMAEIIFSVAFVIVIVSIIKRAKVCKNKNSESKPFQNTISNANNLDSYGNSLSSEPIEIYCEYCGSKYNKHKKRCPNCGAKSKKIN